MEIQVPVPGASCWSHNLRNPFSPMIEKSDTRQEAHHDFRGIRRGTPRALTVACRCIEFGRSDVPYRKEVALPISYRNEILLELHYRVDFICLNAVVVEVKANDTITTRDEAQLLNYLKAAKIRRGLRLNFGAPSLQHKRRVLG